MDLKKMLGIKPRKPTRLHLLTLTLTGGLKKQFYFKKNSSASKNLDRLGKDITRGKPTVYLKDDYDTEIVVDTKSIISILSSKKDFNEEIG